MSVTTHLSTSPPPLAKQALAAVVQDEHTRASPHTHTQSLGLLSPIPSFTSVLSISPTSASDSPTPLTSSSTSSFSSDLSSSHRHAPRTPRTPLRSAATPKGRPSPLFRLLQPFVRATPLSNPTTPTACRTPMALAQTTSQSSSPTVTTSPRSASRSERLLRDALIRDEMERNPTLAAPLADSYESTGMSSPSPKGHRRRHSHVPTSTFSSSLVSSSPERDEYTRGSFLFRTAMNNPRSPSPTPALPVHSSPYYGGDAEGLPMTRRYRHHHHHHSPSVSYQQSPNPKARDHSPLSASPRSTSHSPSPLRRRPAALPLETMSSPVPVPGSSGLKRHNTVASHSVSESPVRRPRSRQEGSPVGEPLVMTPHEQVLRARLERVLSAGRAVEHGEREKQRTRAQRSMSRGNEVRDEEGGWPWHERGEQEVAESVTSSPFDSAPSNNSASSSNQSQKLLENAMIPTSRVPSTLRAVSHNRSRSKTDPISPPPPSLLGPARGSPVPSPRRSSTAPTPSRIPRRKQSSPPSLMPRTGTTPPLVQGEDAEGDDGEDGEMKLLTPPPTPPFTTRVFSLSGTPGKSVGAESYCPSPYKRAFSPMKPLQSQAPPKAGLVFGAPRRPRHAPIDRPQSSESDHEREQDSSSSSSRNSQASFPASNTSSAYAYRQRSRSADIQGNIGDALHSPIAGHPEHHPQFNARKASARCRAIEGYVSFASVEGLGEPPADPMSPDDADLEHERGRTGVLGVAWGGWKRLLNVAGLEGHAVKDGGVVL